MPEFQQVYKTRAAAFDGFLSAQGLPVSRAKFYEDAKRLRLVQPDKTVRLGDLLAYVKEELKVEPLTGQSLEERDHAREKTALELRKLRAEVEARERANRREDERWMEVVEHETQMAAFAGRLEEALQQAAALRLPDLVYRCGGDPGRASELAEGLDQLHAAALSDAVREQVRTVAFEDEAHAA